MEFVREVVLEHTCNAIPDDCKITGNRRPISKKQDKLTDIKWKLREEGIEYGKSFYGLYFCPFCGKSLPNEKTIKIEI